MVGNSIAHARFLVNAAAVGVGGFFVGAGTTFILGLSIILMGGVMTSPTAVVDFMGGYDLTLRLFLLSLLGGTIFLVWRVYLYRKRCC